MEKEYLDLFEPLMVDTYLIAKIGTKFVHYGVKIDRSDGTQRSYGDLYKYFTQTKDFRFAMGLCLVDEDGANWYGKNQYFYFDKGTAPYLLYKETQRFICPKRRK